MVVTSRRTYGFLKQAVLVELAIVIAPHGGVPVNGYPATILADICEAVLAARGAGVLQPQQMHIASQCEILVRGFARVGLIALVDEATGYQKDRARDALARILEKFVAKELQPYVKTFPPDYYEELFRLRGLKYPPDNPKFRPQYFGVLTNDTGKLSSWTSKKVIEDKAALPTGLSEGMVKRHPFRSTLQNKSRQDPRLAAFVFPARLRRARSRL